MWPRCSHLVPATNASTRPVVYFYLTVTRGGEFSVDATGSGPSSCQNPLMPDAALVSTVGYFVTLDDVDRLGSERSLVIYAPDGRLVRSFALDQLFAPADIRRIGITKCGIHRRDGATYYLPSQRESLRYRNDSARDAAGLYHMPGLVWPDSLSAVPTPMGRSFRSPRSVPPQMARIHLRGLPDPRGPGQQRCPTSCR